jgi:hypothetical protein
MGKKELHFFVIFAPCLTVNSSSRLLVLPISKSRHKTGRRTPVRFSALPCPSDPSEDRRDLPRPRPRPAPDLPRPLPLRPSSLCAL